MHNMTITLPAHMARGFAHVGTNADGERVECHAASTFRHSDLSASLNTSGSNKGTSPRSRKESQILTFWESQGVARYNKRAGGVWEGRDAATGEWLPFATQGEETRADKVVFSHVISAENGGAWCACNLIPEAGSVNAARGSLNMEPTPSTRATLAAWRGWWLASDEVKAVARKRIAASTY